MDRIARAVEPSMGYRHQMPEPGEETTVGRAMSNAACDLAETLGASAILVPTFTGRTASAVARLRPRRPIVGLSHHQTAVQQMALEWGVTPVLMPQTDDVEDLWTRALESALKSGVVEPGDRVVTTAGTAVNLPGSTNVIKVDIAYVGRMTAARTRFRRCSGSSRRSSRRSPAGAIAELGTSYGDGAKAIVAALPAGDDASSPSSSTPSAPPSAREALAGTRGRGARRRLARAARRRAARSTCVFADGGGRLRPTSPTCSRPGGILVKDDLTPGRPVEGDATREALLLDERLEAVEILVTPEMACIVAVRRA